MLDCKMSGPDCLTCVVQLFNCSRVKLPTGVRGGVATTRAIGPIAAWLASLGHALQPLIDCCLAGASEGLVVCIVAPHQLWFAFLVPAQQILWVGLHLLDQLRLVGKQPFSHGEGLVLLGPMTAPHCARVDVVVAP